MQSSQTALKHFCVHICTYCIMLILFSSTKTTLEKREEDQSELPSVNTRGKRAALRRAGWRMWLELQPWQ